MRLNKIIQRDYTSFSLYYQIKLPLDLEISIPSDDPVRLVSAFVEEMDLSELYKTYGRIRKNQATPRQMLKLVIYAAMNRIYSSRDIRKACKRDINFMYLLICWNGRELTVTNERRSKTASGYVSVKTYYRSPDCTGCPYKTECIKGNNCKTPMEKRNKVLMVSKTMSQKRAEDLERITSEYGTMLRMNRSIQAEGSFADVKEDMNFRRYLYRGKANALAESILLAMGRNINKLHCKIQTGRTGSHLFSLKTA